MNGDRMIGLVRKALTLLRAAGRQERDAGGAGRTGRRRPTPEERPSTRSRSGPSDRPQSRPQSRSQGRPESQPESRPTSRPESRSGRPRAAPSADSELGDARIEYSPALDGDADPGEVVWTWVPYEDDPSQGKDRPVMIFGRRGDRLVGVALTSKHHANEPQIAVGTGSWDREGRPSYAKLERILDVDPHQVRREGAVLPRARFDEVVDALRALHGLVERHG